VIHEQRRQLEQCRRDKLAAEQEREALRAQVAALQKTGLAQFLCVCVCIPCPLEQEREALRARVAALQKIGLVYLFSFRYATALVGEVRHALV
jgi:hypothetical protein